MTTADTTCVYCERRTRVDIAGEEITIVGKTKDSTASAEHWAVQRCENCDNRFGIKYV